MCCTRSPACVLNLKQRSLSGLGEHCRYHAERNKHLIENDNPFDSPQANSQLNNARRISIVKTSAVGALVGFVLGAIGIAVLFMSFPGMPGVLEILLLIVVVAVLMVLPCAAIGAAIGLVLNSFEKKGAR